MRKINFRAWDKFEKRMVKVSSIYFPKKKNKSFYVNNLQNDDSEHFYLMQCTGLKDEKGVEIFEGDIVNCWGGEFCQGFWEFQNKCIVEWNGIGFDFVDIESNCGIGYGFVNIFEHFEVIGNKYENPELMEHTCNYKVTIFSKIENVYSKMGDLLLSLTNEERATLAEKLSNGG